MTIYIVRWSSVGEFPPMDFGPFSSSEDAASFARTLPETADHRGFEISALVPPEDWKAVPNMPQEETDH